MKKIITILLIVSVLLTFAACGNDDNDNVTNGDTAEKFRQDYENYDWETGDDSTLMGEARRFLDRFDKLPAVDQSEVQDIKKDLDQRVNSVPSELPDNIPSPTIPSNPSDPDASPSPSPVPNDLIEDDSNLM